MDRLPDEIILRIINFVAINERQLLELEQVSKKLRCLVQDQTVWYQLFQRRYRNWGRHVPYASRRPLVDWRTFVIHLSKQKQRSRSFTFDFVSEEQGADPLINRKRKLHELARSSSSPSPPSYKNLSRHQAITQRNDNDYYYNNNNNNEDNVDDNDNDGDNDDNNGEDEDEINMSYPNSMETDYVYPNTATMSDYAFDRDSIRRSFNRHHSTSSPFRIQDPLVVDINRVTRTGIVATGKHRKTTVCNNVNSNNYMMNANSNNNGSSSYANNNNNSNNSNRHHYQTRRSEHKILFWEYPSWRLVRELEITFVPPEITCQVVGIQTIYIKRSDHNDVNPTLERVRLFALAIGQPIDLHNIHLDGHELDDADGNDDRVDLWQAVLIYRLYDNGSTQCLAHLPLDGRFMGREVFFFSDYSWTFGDTSDNNNISQEDSKRRQLKDWIRVVAPEHKDYDPQCALFMLAIGPTSTDTDGCGKLIQFDLRGHANIVDPSITPVKWNPASRRIVPAFNLPMSSPYIQFQRAQSSPSPSHHHYQHYNFQQPRQPQQQQEQQRLRESLVDNMIMDASLSSPPTSQPTTGPSAKIIHNIYLGSHVSCMIHFCYPTHLNHLICTGSYDNNELSIYDWRFGVKVGTLPWKVESESRKEHMQHRHSHTHFQQQQQQDRQEQEEEVEIMRHQRRRHQPERTLPPPPPPPPPPTRPDLQGIGNDGQLQSVELEDAVTVLDQMLMRNRREEFGRMLTGRIEEQGDLDQREALIGDGEEEEEEEDDDDDGNEDDEFGLGIPHEVRPWGLESTMVLPPYWDVQAPTREELAHRGFRLIAVGDNRMNRLEIKVWDISFLLQQEWDPLKPSGNDDNSGENDDNDIDDNDTISNNGIMPGDRNPTLILPPNTTRHNDGLRSVVDDWQKRAEWKKMFPWWQRGTRQLRLLGLRMVHERAQLDERRYASSALPFELRRLLKHEPELRQLADSVQWPLSPPQHHRTMLLAHAFDKPATGLIDHVNHVPSPHHHVHHFGGLPMTVKYTAYNVLYTSLFLLTEDGKVTVMDIETGQVTGMIDNVAATAVANDRMDPSFSGRVRGIDVNVVAGHEVVVTSREGLLRSIMSS